MSVSGQIGGFVESQLGSVDGAVQGPVDEFDVDFGKPHEYAG